MCIRDSYQSVDIAASSGHKPQAVSGKGSASDRIIAEAQGSLFTEEELEAAARASRFVGIDVGVWYFCVSVDGDDVRAELSLPTAVEGGNFKDFIERIFILSPREWSGLAVKPESSGDAIEFEPVISRK